MTDIQQVTLIFRFTRKKISRFFTHYYLSGNSVRKVGLLSRLLKTTGFVNQMRITSCTILLCLFGYGQATAQSWIDQIPAILQEESVSMVVSNYFADEKLFTSINRLREEQYQLESIPFDTTGQYTRSKKELDRFLQFIAQNINIIPIRHNSKVLTYRKSLNYEESGQMEVSIHKINTTLVEDIFAQNIRKTLDNWFGDKNKSHILRLNGLSAVTATKMLIRFDNQDGIVKVTWKYVSSYTLNTFPENMARTGDPDLIDPSKKR